jgi:hypothetical protein
MMFIPGAFCFTRLRKCVTELPFESYPLMKWSDLTRHSPATHRLLAVFVGAWLICPSLQSADTAFHYQGTLATDGQPAEGVYDLSFTLQSAESGDAPLGASFLALAVAVTNGLVAVDVDFGPGLFNGDPRWLEIAIRPSNGPDDFVTLAPRQPLRAAPFALFALEAATATTATSASTATRADTATTADIAIEMPWLGLSDVPEGFSDGIDNDTQYSAGDGLELVDTQFAVATEGINASHLADGAVTATKLADASIEASKLSATNALPGQFLLFDGSEIVWTNFSWYALGEVPADFADGIDNDTQYTAGTGLDLVDGVFGVRFDGSGAADTAARSDHTHPPGDADTLDGLDSLDFAPVTHSHDLAELAGSLTDAQLSPNIPRLDADQLFSGTNQFDGVVLLTNLANVVVGAFYGDGANLTNLSAFNPGSIGSEALADGSVIAGKLAPNAVQPGTIAPDAVSGDQIADATIGPADLALDQFDGSFWKVGGNAGVGPGFLGTSDAQPLEFRVHGTRALRLEPNGTNGVNLVAGSAANVIEPNIEGATISGGGSAFYLGSPHVNRVGGDFASIGGGSRNVIEPTAQWSTISGGLANAIRLNAQWSTISGGNRNQIELDADGAAIVGGRTNTISPGAREGFIGGGSFNRIQTNASFATIPGGQDNTAAGNFSFAAGRQAAALHHGAFVWADNSGLEQTSTNENQCTVRAAGGTRIFSDANSIAGVILPPGEGAWSNLCDRDAKTGFAPVDVREVLERLATLPLHEWRYRTQPDSPRHLGPTAQDFHTQFNLGGDDRHIATIDADGVALAGIQGLNLKLEAQLRQKDQELAELRLRMDRLSAQLDELQGLRATNP